MHGDDRSTQDQDIPARLGIVVALMYLATVFGSNWAIERYGIVPVGFGIQAPAGVYFAGIAFTLRDLTQVIMGRRIVILAILSGAALSFGVAPRYAIASGTAFLFSELCDYAIYTRLERRAWISAVVASNSVGLVLDSAVFLWLAFSSLTHIAGQMIGKTWMTLLAVLVLIPLRRRWIYAHQGPSHLSDCAWASRNDPT